MKLILISLLFSTLCAGMPNDNAVMHNMNMAEADDAEAETFYGVFDEAETPMLEDCEGAYFVEWVLETHIKERRGLDNAKHMIDTKTYHRRRKKLTKAIQSEKQLLNNLKKVKVDCKGFKNASYWKEKINKEKGIRK